MARSFWSIGTLVIAPARLACGRKPTPSPPSMTWSYAALLAPKIPRLSLRCTRRGRGTNHGLHKAIIRVAGGVVGRWPLQRTHTTESVWIEGERCVRHCSTIVLLALILLTSRAYAQEGTTLQLVQTIPLPHVEGRIDHLAVDLQGQRLFVAALGNNTLEVLDLKAGTRLHSITGLHEPQGVVFIPE